jgi:ribosomal protein S17E
MKIQLKKIVEVLLRLKDDDFYFKSYAPEIIESYADEIAKDFMSWCEENTGRVDKYSDSEKLVIFKRERNNIT